MAPRKKVLTGRYTRLNDAFLRQRASRVDDPRYVFCVAMSGNDTFEGYDAAVEGIQVLVPSYKKGPINGRMELLYARRSGWIADDHS
jgi:hypothetical protein